MEWVKFDQVLQQCAAEVDWPVAMRGEVLLIVAWGVQTGTVVAGDGVEGMVVVDWLGFCARAARLAQLCEVCQQWAWAERLRQAVQEAMGRHAGLAKLLGELDERAWQRRRAREH